MIPNEILKNLIYEELGGKNIYSSFMGTAGKSLWKVNYNLLKSRSIDNLKDLDYFIEVSYKKSLVQSIDFLTVIYTDLMYMWFNEQINAPSISETISQLINKKCGIPIPKYSMHEELKKSRTIDIKKFTITFGKPNTINIIKNFITSDFDMELNIDDKKIICKAHISSPLLDGIFARWNTIKFTTNFTSIIPTQNIKQNPPIIQKDVILALILACMFPIELHAEGFECKDVGVRFDIENSQWVYKNKAYRCNYPDVIARIIELGSTGHIEWAKIINS